MSATSFTLPMMPLALLASLMIAAAAPTAPGDDPCDDMLTRMAKVGEARGYRVSLGASAFTATRDEAETEARCSAGHLEIALADASGSWVRVDFRLLDKDTFALEVVGTYRGIGTVTRTAMIDASDEPLSGFMTFAADVGHGVAIVEFGLDGELLAEGGAGEAVLRLNAAFAPTLSASKIWRDAQAFGHAAAGIWDAGLVEHEAELEVLIGLAIPSPDPVAKVDTDSKDAVQKCGVATAVCVVAAWLPPAGGWACGVALGQCLAALPCLPGDCAGDGV